MRAVLFIFITFLLAEMTTLSHAVEVGDVITLSANGVSATVTTIEQIGPRIYAIIARATRENASKYCQSGARLGYINQNWLLCVEKNIGKTDVRLQVDCRHPTIIIDGDNAYRPNDEGDTWVSVADQTSINHADALFQQVCQRPRH